MMTTTNAAKERGISFSPAMLAAIREGRKTQTRRIIKPQPASEYWALDLYRAGKWGERPLPYRPGARLYVKEALERSGHRVTYAFGREIAHRDGAAVAWPWKPERLGAMYMPKWAARTWLEVESIKVERVHCISEADAIAEGFTQQTCAAVFNEAAGKHVTAPCAVVEDDGGGFGDHYCMPCAERFAKKRPGHEAVWYSYPGDYPETDGPAYCEECGVTLEVSLTAYGIERELFLEGDWEGKEPKHWPAHGRDARIAQVFADGIGDLQDDHLGRLAQVGFATKWDSLHGKGAWERNDWVWAIKFKVCN